MKSIQVTDKKVLGVFTEILENSPAENIGAIRAIDRICSKLEAAIKSENETQKVMIEDAEFELISKRFKETPKWNPQLRSLIIQADDALQNAKNE